MTISCIPNHISRSCSKSHLPLLSLLRQKTSSKVFETTCKPYSFPNNEKGKTFLNLKPWCNYQRLSCPQYACIPTLNVHPVLGGWHSVVGQSAHFPAQGVLLQVLFPQTRHAAQQRIHLRHLGSWGHCAHDNRGNWRPLAI